MVAHGRGITLLELLFSLSISCVLVCGAVSGLAAISERTHRDLALRTTLSTLDRARSLAVIRNTPIAICMLNGNAFCSEDWSGEELAVFSDNNKNRQRDDGEEMIYRQPWPGKKTRLRWSNWRSERVISYQPNGSVVSNGTLYIDDTRGNNIHALVISKPGRTRIVSAQ